MIVSAVIKSSMRKLGLVASGETPTAEEYADGLEALQVMLRSWSAEKIIVHASTKESFTLTAGTYLYTWGAGGTFNSARPHQLTGAYILDSGGNSYPVELISEGKYRAITVKTSSDRPFALFLQPTFPLANVYLFPVPNAVESLYVDSWKPFTETSSFNAITDTLSFPVNYEEPMIFNLAVRFGSEFGKAVPAEVAAIASKSYDRLTNLNASQQVEPVSIIVPAGRAGGHYNIDSDTYR
jgi:hypothetical protein